MTTERKYQPSPYKPCDAYEIEKDKQYLVVNYRERNGCIQKDGMPTYATLHHCTEQEIKKVIKKLTNHFYREEIEIYPATLDQIKELYGAKGNTKDMTFLCESCTVIEGCPQFTPIEKYNILYHRDYILDYYSHYRSLAFQATVIKCHKFKGGKINRKRGFTIRVTACKMCPWHRDEEVYDDNSEHYCGRAGTYIEKRRETMSGEVNYIPDWCPELPENNKKVN